MGTQSVKVRFFLDGLTRRQREGYRTLRAFGFTREQANLVVFGTVVAGRGGDVSVALRERIRVRFGRTTGGDEK